MKDKDILLAEKKEEECGIFGIYYNDGCDDAHGEGATAAARLTYYALYALQHRGQDSAGIAVCNNGEISYYKDVGLVPEAFNDAIISSLSGDSAIGHVRYSTTGAGTAENAQPLVVKYMGGQMALAHNGNLVNISNIKKRLEEKGAIFHTSSDTEIIASMLSMKIAESKSVKKAIIETMKEIEGAYSLVILADKKLIGVRDPWGIRPLCLGRLKNSYIIASESCALDAVEAEFIRDIAPGEVVIIEDNGIEYMQVKSTGREGICIFEFVYFARPDSVIDGASVYMARYEAGRQLAEEHPVRADLVIGAPDSALVSALGYSTQSGIPYGQGLLKNRYVGRTFIQPEQRQREASVSIKFNAIKSEVDGKSIVIVDDSIVRGTTTRRIVKMLRNAGAREIHMRISSPPVKFPCFLGIAMSSKEQLVASYHSREEIREMIGADSIGFLNLEGLVKTLKGIKCGLCTGCFNGDYPL
ncbi:MAG: amidophosphoribosyltransferase [Clostridiaceae bacterium]|nr:amidophosphoribosyltransferase [Clostridiaceae bacterium]